MREGVFSVYQSAMKAYMDINLDALEEANRYEELVDQLTEQMADRNVARLSNNEYNPVLHKPHSSRPWKQLKYTNPLLYYWRKLTQHRDKI